VGHKPPTSSEAELCDEKTPISEKSEWRAEDWLNRAFLPRPFPAVQLVWPDKQWRFPWEANYCGSEAAAFCSLLQQQHIIPPHLYIFQLLVFSQNLRRFLYGNLVEVCDKNFCTLLGENFHDGFANAMSTPPVTMPILFWSRCIA